METYRSFATSAAGDRFATPPEKHLAIAVLMTAIEDLAKRRRGDAMRDHRDAENWVRSADEVWPFSFVNLCALLNIPVDDLRTKLLQSPSSCRDMLGDVAA